jgi:Leucine-rich repeat (LRR) protein
MADWIEYEPDEYEPDETGIDIFFLVVLPRIEKALTTGERSLDLSYKQLTQLPESIGQLTQLEYLDLRRNWLKGLPEGIAQLPQLWRLRR